ncbi:unnamed protein product, partial [Prorocentrum cordatum]
FCFFVFFRFSFLSKFFADLGEHLQHDSALVRQAAVRCVSKVARRGNEAAAAVLGVLCRDRDQLVRKAAVEVLGQVAPRGDRQAISVVVDCLVDDPFQGVRRAAVDTLGMIGEKGDQQVISKAGRRLENKNDEFIMSVAAALEQLRGL